MTIVDIVIANLNTFCGPTT